MRALAREVKRATGLNIREFCERELLTDYKAFMMRLNKDRVYPGEILYILDRVKKPVTEVFGRTFEDLFIHPYPCGCSKQVTNFLKDPDRRQQVYELLGVRRLADVPQRAQYLPRVSRKR